LLVEKSIIKDETLTVLFSLGDERIQDLIRALDDPNKVVRRNAQAVIRYLGNDAGMKALIEGYQKSRILSLAGPVPLPLRDWDYEYVRKQYLQKSGEWDQRAASYIYALALDGGPKATALLSELAEKMEKGVIPYHHALYQVKAIQPRELLVKETDLAKLVVDNAFFISSGHREHALARLLGFNHAKDKALIKVNVGGVPLAEESYHIVLERRREGWSFFSVTLVAVS
jgi:HEAT repeat protein